MPSDDEADASALEVVPLDSCAVRVGDEVYCYLAFRRPPPPTLNGLTPAEREVAQLVLRGLGTRSIADARGTTRRTAENQLASVFRKLGICSRDELVSLLSGEPL